MSLTPKQQRFISEFLIDLNATQAAIRAGYSNPTARQAGAENLSKPDVSAAIAEAQAARAERTGMTQDYVLEHLCTVVETCMGRTGGEFNASGAIKALELLGKHLGMFKDRIEVKVTIDPVGDLMKALDGKLPRIPTADRSKQVL